MSSLARAKAEGNPQSFASSVIFVLNSFEIGQPFSAVSAGRAAVREYARAIDTRRTLGLQAKPLLGRLHAPVVREHSVAPVADVEGRPAHAPDTPPEGGVRCHVTSVGVSAIADCSRWGRERARR